MTKALSPFSRALRIQVRLLLGSLLPLFIVGPPAASAADAPLGWLNARDFGASGSEYSTTAATTKGAKAITVQDVGDFQVGQGVMLSESNPHISQRRICGPRGVVTMGRTMKKEAEIRGYDGSQGDWVVLVLDVAQGSKTFRWTEDLARTWHETVPITGDWQAIRDGIEVRFNDFEWEKGYTVVFGCRGQLITTIEKIEGNTVTLHVTPTRTVPKAVLRHCDDSGLQKAIAQALKENRNLYVPIGRYRLSKSLYVNKPDGLTIEGENAIHTILDISEGNSACIRFSKGKAVTFRNFTMVGHSGFDRRDQCGYIPMKGSSYFWGFAAKNCNATSLGGTERVLMENCHGTRMASECFVAGGRGRKVAKPEGAYAKSVTYLRCSATDCARNGFNDVTCGPENTSVINCRIVDVGGCAWEGASRFVKFTGNYVRNAGTVAIGNLGEYNRDASFPELGAGQHIVSNNVFESVVPYGSAAICSARGATQVIISSNLFVNFGSSAVNLSGSSNPTGYASANTSISGNIFDMTEIGGTSKGRVAINVDASDTTISDNQIYVRGTVDPNVTAVRVKSPSINVSLHDNLIRNCGYGILTTRNTSRVGEVIDSTTFAASLATVPLEPRYERQCEGWRLVWLAGTKAVGESVLDAITGAAKPETRIEDGGPLRPDSPRRQLEFPQQYHHRLPASSSAGPLRQSHVIFPRQHHLPRRDRRRCQRRGGRRAIPAHRQSHLRLRRTRSRRSRTAGMPPALRQAHHHRQHH